MCGEVEVAVSASAPDLPQLSAARALFGAFLPCSAEQLRRVYLRLALKYHPDKCKEEAGDGGRGCWVVGWSVGRLVGGWVGGWLVGWLAGWSVGWKVGWLVARVLLFGCLFDPDRFPEGPIWSGLSGWLVASPLIWRMLWGVTFWLEQLVVEGSGVKAALRMQFGRDIRWCGLVEAIPWLLP